MPQTKHKSSQSTETPRGGSPVPLLVLGRVSGRWEGREQRGAPHSTPEGTGAQLLPTHLARALDNLPLNITGKPKNVPEVQAGLRAWTPILHPACPQPRTPPSPPAFTP